MLLGLEVKKQLNFWHKWTTNHTTFKRWKNMQVAKRMKDEQILGTMSEAMECGSKGAVTFS